MRGGGDPLLHGLAHEAEGEEHIDEGYDRGHHDEVGAVRKQFHEVLEDGSAHGSAAQIAREDDAGGEAVIGNLISTVLEQKDNIDLSNPDKILADTNIPKEKYEEVKNILSNSANGFTKGEVIK